ncbi:MAG: hypothetical protein JW768_08780 [Chitinispirillaceae bacterium]|nr:hypothetical protein [Chitinispirillaceae bacterium]
MKELYWTCATRAKGHPFLFFRLLCGIIVYLSAGVQGEPIVINGSLIPELVGTPLCDVRVINSMGMPIPFQIDEITQDGEYVCPEGEKPNTDKADGTLHKQDEIVFLWKDAHAQDTLSGYADSDSGATAPVRVTVTKQNEKRYVWICNDRTKPLSANAYITYDHERQLLGTPYYFAQFARDRFHFIRAGIMDFEKKSFFGLTNELRVVIMLKALWGLLPITYTEESIVCRVKRYKQGPIRLIRRGDFHLKVGLGIKGSRAVVYQMCYPQIVKVPVRVHLPVRFRFFFKEAFIEMTPVLSREAGAFRFMIPSIDFTETMSAHGVDTLIPAFPDKGYLVSDGSKGYGWITRMSIDSSFLPGSGYVLRRPSTRQGLAECGFRLSVRDLPRGYYDIVNWVFFSRERLEGHAQELLSVLAPSTISSGTVSTKNLLATSPSSQRAGK